MTSDESVCAKCGTPAEAGLIFCKKCSATLRPPVPLVASTPKSVHTDGPIYADAIGLVLIAVHLTVLFWWLVPDDGTRFIAGIVAYGVLVGLALAMWYILTRCQATSVHKSSPCQMRDDTEGITCSRLFTEVDNMGTIRAPSLFLT